MKRLFLNDIRRGLGKAYIELEKTNDNEFTFNRLNEYGIKAISRLRSVSKELLEKL